MYLRDQFFVINANSNDWNSLNDTTQDKKERSHIDTLLIYALWYEFSNDFEAQSEFGKKMSQKTGPMEPFFSKNML